MDVIGVAANWWLERQIKNIARDEIPVVGEAAAFGDALGAAAAVAKQCLYNRAHPQGYWPGDKGAEEWGRRNGIGKDAGRRKFHEIKGGDNISRGNDDYGVNPGTGDIVDPSGESIGNLDDSY